MGYIFDIIDATCIFCAGRPAGGRKHRPEDPGRRDVEGIAGLDGTPDLRGENGMNRVSAESPPSFGVSAKDDALLADTPDRPAQHDGGAHARDHEQDGDDDHDPQQRPAEQRGARPDEKPQDHQKGAADAQFLRRLLAAHAEDRKVEHRRRVARARIAEQVRDSEPVPKRLGAVPGEVAKALKWPWNSARAAHAAARLPPSCGTDRVPLPRVTASVASAIATPRPVPPSAPARRPPSPARRRVGPRVLPAGRPPGCRAGRCRCRP